MFDGLPFDPFALFDDGIGPAEVGVGGRHVVQALVVTSVVIMLDERFDLGLKVAGQERSEEHTSELQSLMRSSYAVFCLKKTNCETLKRVSVAFVFGNLRG